MRQIIDVSNPASPVRLGGYDTAGTAYAVAVSGTLAYVADDTSGLQVIEVLKGVSAATMVDGVTVHVDLAVALPDGQYQVRVGPAIADPTGNTMDQDGDGIGGEIPGDICAFSFTVDNTPPPAPGNLTFADDTGSTGDRITADTSLVFTWWARPMAR